MRSIVRKTFSIGEMDNVHDDPHNGDHVYDTEDTDDDNELLQYEFVPRAVETSRVSKRSQGWTEKETFVMLEAWGERLLKHNRKCVQSDEWHEVANKVSEFSKLTRTKTHCRNRMDTLKRTYKKEKAKLAENEGYSSKWVYFAKMDMIIASSLNQANGCGIMKSEVHLNRSNSLDERKEIENSKIHQICVNSADEMNNIPVGGSEFAKDKSHDLDVPPKKRRMFKKRRVEKNESRKREQNLVELEKMRIDLQRDLELERRKILRKGRIEMAKIWGHDIEENDISPGNNSG